MRSNRLLQIAARVASGLAAALLGTVCHKPQGPHKPYLAFVANQGSQSVAVIDLGSLSLAKVIGLNQHPGEIGPRPRSRELYVAGDRGVDVLEYSGLRLARRWAVAGGASHLTFSPDGKKAFLIEGPEGKIAVFDASTGQAISLPPSPASLSGIALTRDGKTLVAESKQKNVVYFIDAETLRPLGSVGTGLGPGSMVIAPGDQNVFIADTAENLITVAAIHSSALFTYLEIGDAPTTLILKPDGGEIFALSASGTRMTILDATAVDVEQVLSTGHHPAAGVFSPDSSRFYWTNAGDGTISALDVSTRQVLASTRIGVAPQDLALTPDGRYLAVLDGGSSSVEVVEAASTHLLNTIATGAQPVSIVIPAWQN
jgi:YVTN family beta-propeller protein